ncbi:MAG TPA: exosortase T [Hyphomicrobiaceae bacterium]|nr:exosortase T [Hyphomicrobiaceae bacterium]
MAGIILAAGPFVWLIRTWRDPAYDSSGFIVFLVAAGLFGWSWSSRLPRSPSGNTRFAIILLAASAIMRLAGQLMAINTIGAVCLVIDVYAIAVICPLPERARPVSAVWLAAVFAMSLPVERILQRTIGYGLQQLSAEGACVGLKAVYGDVVCHGVRIIVAGTDVLVDLPCSGARALLLCMLAFAIAATLCRPAWMQALVGAVTMVVAAIAANILRITLLAVGLADPASLDGINVMAAPWHDAIGLMSLALSILPLLAWTRWVRVPSAGACQGRRRQPELLPTRISADGWWLVSHQPPPRPVPIAVGVSALALSLLIVNLPHRPLDVSTPPPRAANGTPFLQGTAIQALPLSIDGHVAEPVQLTAREHIFFTQFGGWAAKARYGDNALMLVQTSSPLRHLHEPGDCLRGLGFKVSYLGTHYTPIPTAAYSATAPGGQRYRIDVSFISDRGEITPNVATAVWRWLQGNARSWTAIHRITLAEAPESARLAWANAVTAALELPRREASPEPSKTTLSQTASMKKGTEK